MDLLGQIKYCGRAEKNANATGRIEALQTPNGIGTNSVRSQFASGDTACRSAKLSHSLDNIKLHRFALILKFIGLHLKIAAGFGTISFHLH